MSFENGKIDSDGDAVELKFPDEATGDVVVDASRDIEFKVEASVVEVYSISSLISTRNGIVSPFISLPWI